MQALAQVILKSVSGLSEDIYVNTFAFSDGATSFLTNAAATEIVTNLTSFYNTTHAPGLAPIAADISSNVSRTANDSTIKIYDFLDPSPRVPYGTSTFTLGAAASGAGLPSEVALCLSFQGAKISGQDQARRRGRVYIGPLGSTKTTSVSGDLRPNNALINELVGAGTFLSTVTFTSGLEWCVYSRTGNQFVPVTSGWVDDAFDTQRRRGKRATFRTTF